MLTDKQIEALCEELVAIYNRMEMQLFKDVIMRFQTYEEATGALKWNLNQLEELGLLNRQAVETISKYSGRGKEAIREMLKKAQFANFDKDDMQEAYKNGMIQLSMEQLQKLPIVKQLQNAAYKGFVNDTIKLIETKALESTKQAYIESASGTYSHNQAITRAIEAMAKHGIYGATYRREDGTIRRMSIEAVVRRDAISASTRLANDTMAKCAEEMGAEYVETTSHLGARIGDGQHDHTNHAWWQGKVYALHGKGSAEANEAVGYEIQNFADTTGYGEVDGIGGVNCRHRFFAFFPGITTQAAEHYDEDKNAEIYQATQKQRRLERNIRRWKKVRDAMKAMEDTPETMEAADKAQQHIDKLSQILEAHCDKYDLRRSSAREQYK
jgi:hypothetical protein